MAAKQQAVQMTLSRLLPDVTLPESVAGIGVCGIALDSRLVEPGFLFLACPGMTTDGRNYLEAAINSGAVAVLAEAEGLSAHSSSVPVIPVVKLAERVSDIAGRFYGNPSLQMQVVGVTGTNGKTTCTQLLAQLYELLGERAGVVGTLGYGLLQDGDIKLCDTGMTTPDAVQMQDILARIHADGATRACIEVSSHSLAQARIAGLRIKAAVFTNLSRDHLDYHGSVDSYRSAKASLFAVTGLELAVVNGDDPASEHMLAALPKDVTRYRYAIDDQTADVVASKVDLSSAGIRAHITTPWGEGNIQTSLIGAFNLSNLLAVIATACGQGFTLSQVLACVPNLRPIAGRMEVVHSNSRPVVVVDYAHTPDALEKALQSVRGHCRGRLWCVFGCGGDRDRGKRPLMGKVAAQLADRVVVTSDNPRSETPENIIADILAGISGAAAATVICERAAAIRDAITRAAPEDCVLIAGKGHEAYQDIDGKRLPFSDIAVARTVLAEKGREDEAGTGSGGEQ